jgi:dihydroxyacetone kinase-like predicted kinase
LSELNIFPLPEADSGYKYAATMTDYFSKWTEVKALKSKRASDVVDFVFDTISTFGCMVFACTFEKE